MSAAHFEELLRYCPNGLAANAWRLLAVACYRAREDGEIVESKSRLAEECGLSKPTISRAFTQLLKQKLLFCKDDCKSEKIFINLTTRASCQIDNKSCHSDNKSFTSDALIKNTHSNECASGGAGAYERVRVVSASANFIAARHLTDEQRRFIDAYGKRPRDYEAFTAEWERLCATVSPAQLTACATAAVEDLLKRGELQFLKKPENWLADNEHRQYLDRLPAAASAKSWEEVWATETWHASAPIGYGWFHLFILPYSALWRKVAPYLFVRWRARRGMVYNGPCMRICGRLSRVFLTVLCLAWSAGWALAAPDAPGTFRLRAGPFFEWGSREGEATRLAVRPFFAWERSERNPADRDMEVVWPLSHFAWRGEGFHGRVALAFWREADVSGERSRDYSFWLSPLWTHGRDADDFHWALFPLWGRLPKFLFLEEVQWRLFPLWLRYRTGGSHGVWRQYYAWPFFSLKEDPDKTRWALWPLYGTKKDIAGPRPEQFEARFVLWPFWNDQTFDSHRHKGQAWMLWPLCERVDADTEQGYGLVPPFFRFVWTVDGARLVRAPWPLFERYTDPRESTWRVGWRLWGMTHRGSRAQWWFCDPVVRSDRQQTENLFTRLFQVWPFWTDEEHYGYDFAGEAHLQSAYFRIWPFFSSAYDERTGLRRKSLVLFPIREVPAVERNWAPFWTFYTATQQAGSDEVLHELFWGLIWWRTRPGDFAAGRAPERKDEP